MDVIWVSFTLFSSILLLLVFRVLLVKRIVNIFIIELNQLLDGVLQRSKSIRHDSLEELVANHVFLQIVIIFLNMWEDVIIVSEQLVFRVTPNSMNLAFYACEHAEPIIDWFDRIFTFDFQSNAILFWLYLLDEFLILIILVDLLVV